MQAIKSLLMFVLPKFIAQFYYYCYSRSESIMLQVSIQAVSPLVFIFIERTLRKTLSLLTLIEKNMLKLCCCLQVGPCWDYLCKWQRDAEISNETAKTRAHFCPKLQRALTNSMP